MDQRRQAGRRGCWIGCLGCGGAALLLAAGAVAAFQWSQGQVVPESLRAVRLAPIPKEARDVRTAGGTNFFTAEVRVRFQASPTIIARYVEDSPALQRIKPEQFSPKHRLLPVAEKLAIEEAKGWDAAQADAAYYPAKQAPWYAPRIVTNGRRWAIPWDQDQFHGEVIIDDAAGWVYITVSRS